MAAINARDARHGFSDVLDRVERGETIEITRHGRVVAVVAPPADHDLAWLDQLLTSEIADTGWSAEHDAERDADRDVNDRDPWG